VCVSLTCSRCVRVCPGPSPSAVHGTAVTAYRHRVGNKGQAATSGLSKASNGQYFRVAQGALLCGATTALLSVLCQSNCHVLCSGGPCMLCCAARPLVFPCSMTCAPTSRACICPAPHQGCQCTCRAHTVRSSGFCFLGYQGGCHTWQVDSCADLIV
jgi:hypothetical protein